MMTADDQSDRRERARFDTHLEVDYRSGENFLFSYIQNISEMGIFIRSDAPLPVGTEIDVRFQPEGEEPVQLRGQVVWVNPVKIGGDNLNPGMGVRFLDLTPELRERLVSLVRTIAYLQDEGTTN